MSYKLYSNLKQTRLDEIVIINTGAFYTTYNKDAELLHELLDYKIILFKNYQKIGFPSIKLMNILRILQIKNINCYVYENSQVFRVYAYPINNYHKYLNKSVDIQVAKRELLMQIHQLLRTKSYKDISIVARTLNIKTNIKVFNVDEEADA
ncbi:MAG: hypothetical protein RSB00_04285 [Bacilli bacterium]